MKLSGWIRTYMAHKDPATGVSNLVAMVVGWNGPLYPIFLIALAGWSVSGPALLTAVAAPFFLAIPAIARRSSRAARSALPIFGTINTLWCIKVLGMACQLELFLIPCVVMSALLYRRNERFLLLLVASISFAANFLPASFFGTPIIELSATAAHHLGALNEGSVVALAFLMAWQFATLLRNVELIGADKPRGGQVQNSR
jgi:hypothetical protein